MKAQIFKNIETVEQGIGLLKSEVGAVLFEERNESDKFGNESIKVVGMDADFEVVGYAIVELDN